MPDDANQTVQVVTRDPDRTRAAILAAATAEFAAKGFGGARVDGIAERAGVNKRMLYHYFGAKDDLYLAVLEAAYADIRAAERGLRLTDRDPEEGVQELARFTWRYFQQHPEFMSLLNTENLLGARHLRRSERLPQLHSSMIGELSTLLRRGAESGVFRDGVDPLHVYLTIAALGFFYLSNHATLSTVFHRDLRRVEETAVWEAHIVRTTLAMLRS